MEHIVPQEMQLLQNTLRQSTIWLGCLQHGTQNKIITVPQYAIKLGFNTDSSAIERKGTWPAPIVWKFPTCKGLNVTVYVMRKGQIRLQGFFWHEKVLFDAAVYNLLPLFFISASPMYTHDTYVTMPSSHTLSTMGSPSELPAELHVNSIRNGTWVWKRALL